MKWKSTFMWFVFLWNTITYNNTCYFIVTKHPHRLSYRKAYSCNRFLNSILYLATLTKPFQQQGHGTMICYLITFIMLSHHFPVAFFLVSSLKLWTWRSFDGETLTIFLATSRVSTSDLDGGEWWNHPLSSSTNHHHSWDWCQYLAHPINQHSNDPITITPMTI